jgi:hypothetical protein
MRLVGKNVANSTCPQISVPKTVIGRDKMTNSFYDKIKAGQMFVNNWRKDSFFDINVKDFFNTCLLGKDNGGNNATITLQTIGGIDDSKHVSGSTDGEIYYNSNTGKFSIHVCACRCYTK